MSSGVLSKIVCFVVCHVDYHNSPAMSPVKFIFVFLALLVLAAAKSRGSADLEIKDSNPGFRNQQADIQEMNRKIHEMAAAGQDSVMAEHARLMEEQRKLIEAMQQETSIKQNSVSKMRETDSEIIVELDLGDVPKESVKVSVSNGELKISAGEAHEKVEKTANTRVVSRSAGAVSQKYTIPRGIDESSMKIHYESETKMIITLQKPKHH